MKRIQTSCLGALLLSALLLPTDLEASSHRVVPQLSARATLSCRGAKPGQHVELIVTVRNAIHPAIASVERPASFRMKTLRQPRLLRTDEGDIWLFRYKIIPMKTGDFEIPPIIVTDASLRTQAQTMPLTLRVSLKGAPPVLTAGELAHAVQLPPSLSEEVMKNAPQTAPKPDPSAAPVDSRPLPARIASTCCKELKAFWNYPGGK
jgi:uncharacterized protein (DUF58 family)